MPVHPGAFRKSSVFCVAGVDVDLGDVELDAVEAVVSSRVCLLADEVRVGVCASRGVLALPALDTGPGGLGCDLAVHDPDVGQSAQGMQVRAPKPVLECRFGHRGGACAQE
jgi:hypothetical protein